MLKHDTVGRPSFAFLLLEEHPYGRQMLQALLGGGLVPALVVQERSTVADVERDKFVQRMRGFPMAPTVDAQLADRVVRCATVQNHNDDACHDMLSATAPELIVLGGTRILKPRIFETARVGTLNAHPGLLPEVRGSASVAWAIELDLPIGSTCHFIEAGIDTGPIVGRREIAVHRGDTYEKLCHATTVLSAELMCEALHAFAEGRLEAIPQPSGGPAHRNMAPDRVAAVQQKLAEGRYLRFVD